MSRAILYSLLVIISIAAVFGGLFLYYTYKENKDYQIIKNRFEFELYEDVIREGTKFLADYPRSKYFNNVEYFVAFSSLKIGKSESAKRRVLSLISRFFNENKNDEILTKSIELLVDILRERNESMNPEIEEYLRISLLKATDQNVKNNILTQLGYIYFYRKDYNNALMYFERAKTELAELGKARVYVEQGDYESAFYIYENFIKYNPNSKYYKSVYDAYMKQLYGYAYKLMKDKEYNLSVRYFEKVLNTFPNTIYEDSSLYWLGEINAIQKKYDESIKFFDRAMNNEPKNKDEDALFKKGVVLYYAGKLIDAVANFKKFLLEYPNSRLAGEAKRWIEVLTREIQYSYQIEDDVE
ncbi:MAG: tetratricopeptide repeat protein [Brevinematales bacterium]|nr:tetratricopeptide repeat protein [Brevinematales bacterium]